jgi:hypothetical protein
LVSPILTLLKLTVTVNKHVVELLPAALKVAKTGAASVEVIIGHQEILGIAEKKQNLKFNRCKFCQCDGVFQRGCFPFIWFLCTTKRLCAGIGGKIFCPNRFSTYDYFSVHLLRA